MPKDNDSIINDILKDTENQKKEKTESEIPQTDDAEKEENFIEKSFKASEFKLRSAETVGDFEEASENSGLNDENVSAESDEIPESDEQPEEAPAKKKKKKKKRKKHHYRLPGVLILTTLIFAVAISLSLVIIAYGKDMLGIGKSENTQLIVIPEGATTEEISLMLEQDGIIKSPEFFQLFSRLSNSDNEYIAGEHFVRPNMAYETIIEELTSIQSEEKVQVSVTFPEGITLVDAATKLESANVCSASDFIFYFNSGGYGFDFENKLNSSTTLKFYRMEGYLFPDTYYFYENMEPEQVCQKIYLNFDQKMTDERYKKMEELGLTLDQLITFSSIVQAEAPSMESMTMVASVFWNRLNNPDAFPLLQSDPTTYYARDVIKPHMEIEDQLILDAYDTYKSPGLPPGPICNPGIEAIDAVLENFPSNYYYFYANVNTSQTYFAETLEEHEENIAMVQQQIAEAGEGE
ncbi:MAG: endolytic transglycosylase MltG [Ruminococcus sp.]|nr:endolytic transglycosylase MltG [Oscillospiraceae bacterium]MDY4414701.1 endolytic transglycosylase MltG [Ruminococcus sp.]